MLVGYQEVNKTRDSYRMGKIDALPLVELHVHTPGGILNKSLIQKLVNNNNKEIRKDMLDENGNIKDEYFDENGNIKFITNKECKDEVVFFEFLAAYDKFTKFVATTKDVEDAIFDYLKRCHQQGAIYVELSCSPDHVKKLRQEYLKTHKSKDNELAKDSRQHHIDYESYVNAIVSAIDKAKAEFGIEARILMVLLRHNGASGCQESLNEIIKYRHPYVVGINLAGDEVNYPAGLFKSIYQQARDNGLKCTVHAGEWGDSKAMHEAVEILMPDRVGHGVACANDTELMEMLKSQEIGLEVCPGSNIALRRYKSLDKHPFKALLDFGLKCSLSTDDPTYFNTTLKKEYQQAKSQWGLEESDLIKITQNAIETSFASEHLKAKLKKRVLVYETLYDLKQHINNFKDDKKENALMTLNEYIRTKQVHSLDPLVDQKEHGHQGVELEQKVLKLKQAHGAYVQALEDHQKFLDSTLNKFRVKKKMK